MTRELLRAEETSHGERALLVQLQQLPLLNSDLRVQLMTSVELQLLEQLRLLLKKPFDLSILGFDVFDVTALFAVNLVQSLNG